MSLSRSSWPTVRLGDVLTRSLDWVTLEPDGRYRQVTVRLWGKGVVLRDEVDGLEIAGARRLRVRSGQLILSRIDARNGAIGIVPDELNGAVVSNDFPSFDLDLTRLLPGFLGWLNKTRAFVDTCRTASEGTTNRIRLVEDRFLAIEIPLPPLDEQRRIVVRLDAAQAATARAQQIAQRAETELDALQRSIATSLPRGSSNSRVGDYISIQSGYAFERSTFSEEGIRLVRNVNIGHGGIDWRQTARLPEGRRPQFERFELAEGDILVSLDRPIISTGVKVAQVRARDLPSLLVQRVGRVRIRSTALDPDFFFAWLQSPMFIDAIDPGRSNGIPHISAKDVEGIPFSPPSIPEQRRAIERMGVLRGQLSEARRLHADLLDELGAVLPVLLSREFRGPDLAVLGS